MLTGFNTDVEYDGVVYHVQTEDKGLQTPFILSLVYTGGAILASKRSPYDDLVARGFDEGVLAQRLSRQHKLICAAVYAGRIEDLKRLNQRNPAQGTGNSLAETEPLVEMPSEKANEPQSISTNPPAREEDSAVVRANFGTSDAEQIDQEPLKVILLDEQVFTGGESVTLRLLVSRLAGHRREPARKARIVVKTLGTTFRPTSTMATTNSQGIATIPILLPVFETGRAAVLIQAHIDGETAELRRIILPAKFS